MLTSIVGLENHTADFSVVMLISVQKLQPGYENPERLKYAWNCSCFLNQWQERTLHTKIHKNS